MNHVGARGILRMAMGPGAGPAHTWPAPYPSIAPMPPFALNSAHTGS